MLRRRREEDSDSDEGASRTSRNLTPLSQGSNGSKRIRLSGRDNGEDDDSALNGGDDAPSPLPLTSTSRTASSGQNGVNGSGGDSDKHGPGAIVRVKLSDFVTYRSAEFFPGPKLNMVIGPNGTGKSTLVCAICLGLGWGPQHLGRAKDAAEFVKHGCREATIEIELAGHPNCRNQIIRRIIKREGNKSTFTLNGKPAAKTKILEVAHGFAIQIDNLCQFLPQDKVSEFAALSPVELLHSTQRAAAGSEMVEWHERLKQLRTEQKRLQVANGGDKETLTNLENRQELQRADVERMKQRTEVKRRIELLEKARPVPKYREICARMNTAKQEKDKLMAELKQLDRETNPAKQASKAKQEYLYRIDAVVKHRGKVLEESTSNAKDIARGMVTADDTMRDLNSQIEAEKKSGQTHREGSKKMLQTINRLKRQIEEEPVQFDAAFYTEAIREKVRLTRELKSKAAELQEHKKAMANESREKTTNIKTAEEGLQNLDSQAGQQEVKLGRLSPETMKAWDWVKKNQDKFEKQVFGPAMVECSVKDPGYADALETLFQKNDFTAFTTQSTNDFRKLQKVLYNDMRLHDISIRTCSAPLNEFQPPVSDERLRSLGFDGWAKDYLTGPDPVLALLCSENRLHQTPVVLRDITDEEYTKMESGPLSAWVAGRQAYQVTRRREYGPDATSTRVRQVRPARYWTNQPVDMATKRDLEEKIRGWTEETQQISKRMEAGKAKLAQITDEHRETLTEKVRLENEKAEKQTALTQYKALPTKLRELEDRKKMNEESFAGFRKRVQDIRAKQDKLSLEAAANAVKYADAVENLEKLYEDLIAAEIRRIEAKSDCETLEERNREINETLKTKNNEMKAAAERFKVISDECTKSFREGKNVVAEGEDNPELRAIVASIKEHSVDQLEADIDSEKARLELTHEGNAGVIEEFEQRQLRIDNLREKLSDFEKQLQNLDEGMAEIRGKWEPKLEKIVQNISDAFSDSFARIGCAGQVSVDKAEDVNPNGRRGNGYAAEDGSSAATPHTTHSSDFDQWSIRIQVKFREHETLSVLDSHRQSGGERAVSTIFYLMALQSLSASPFRVVDEINQGMDPRNERMVHERMVNIACDPNENAGGQYFLITPKLLNGLVYKRGMKVLCIASGEYMPGDYEKVDFGKCVEKMKGVIRARERRRGTMPNGGGNVGVGVGA